MSSTANDQAPMEQYQPSTEICDFMYKGEFLSFNNNRCNWKNFNITKEKQNDPLQAVLWDFVQENVYCKHDK